MSKFDWLEIACRILLALAFGSCATGVALGFMGGFKEFR